jgi:hypothetical protein
VNPDAELAALLKKNPGLRVKDSLGGRPLIPLVVPWLDPQVQSGVLQDRVATLCKDLGYLAYHTYNSKRSTPGWPDHVVCHPDGGPLYLFEYKCVGEGPSPAQQRWLEALARVTHVEAACYTPVDWPTIYTKLTQRGRS